MTLIAAHHTVTVIFSVFNLVYCVASSSTKYAIVHHLFIIKIFRILDSPADRFSPAMLGQHCSVAMEIVLCQQMKINNHNHICSVENVGFNCVSSSSIGTQECRNAFWHCEREHLHNMECCTDVRSTICQDGTQRLMQLHRPHASLDWTPTNSEVVDKFNLFQSIIIAFCIGQMDWNGWLENVFVDLGRGAIETMQQWKFGWILWMWMDVWQW